MKRSSFGEHLRVTIFCTVILLAALQPAIGQVIENLDEEFQFASGLVDLGFADFADKVVQQILRLHPEQKDRAQLVQAEVLISRRRFEDAEKIVREMGMDNTKAQAISLALARGYYAIGETDKASQLYTEFFKRYEGRMPTDPDLLRFYQEAAYQFGQMLEMAGKTDDAIKAYGRILTTKPDRQTLRRVQAKQAELYVKAAASADRAQQEKLLAEAKKLCETIQWGGMDIWFGQSVITLAHMDLVRGDRTAAEKTLMSNMDIFKEIDGFLKEEGLPVSVSPMAGARFLLGELFQQQAETMEKQKRPAEDIIPVYGKALTEYYNVFAKYAESDWGQPAGVRAGAIKSILEDRYGRRVNVDLGQKASVAVAGYFRLPDNLFRQKKYKEALDEYIKTLNQFPETEVTPAALGNMMEAYAELNDTLMLKTIIAYTGERFSGNESAALALLRIGKFFFDKKDEPMYMLAYNTYLDNFPKHSRAAAILFTLAGLKKQQGDEQGASQLFERIVKEYPKDQYYPRALSQMAWGYYAATNFEKAVEGFRVFIKEAQPSPGKALAQFAMAESLRQIGRLGDAAVEYETVIQWLAPKGNPYGTSAADVKKNQELLEKAVFQRAFCYARMDEPAESIQDFRSRAIRGYDQFVSLFADSSMAPSALSAKGTVQLEIGQYDAAMQTFDQLAAKYPNSAEGKSALFALTRSAMEIKLYDQARPAFEKMLANSKAYTPDEFTRVGQLMLDAKLYPEAIKAFTHVSSATEERALLERALFGLGRAYYEQKDYPKATQALEEMMERYPRSGLFHEAKFTLGRAYRETGRLDEAVQVMTDVFKFADTPLLLNQASYDLGMIQKERGEKVAALASFLRIGLLADPKNPELSPLVEKSLIESINLGMELERYDDVIDSAELYMTLFPESAQIGDVRQARADARMKAAQAPGVPAPEATQP